MRALTEEEKAAVDFVGETDWAECNEEEQAALVDFVRKFCTCGAPATPGVVHTRLGPCHAIEEVENA